MTMTDTIKKQIPAWMTDAEIERLRNQFDPAISTAVFAFVTRAASSWKRESKNHWGAGYERVFDCRPYEQQLRCYVYTDPTDTHIVRYVFQTE